MAGLKSGTTTTHYLTAVLIDKISTLQWMLSEDGHKGRKFPKSLAENLLAGGEKESEVMSFRDSDAFEAARAGILKKISGG